ncbi:MAG TPA: SAM-dependent DNA methyltransferase [Bacteroidetes bacterium]|nr:SAM-dependent DNA methyltransferase [Bacteroidota bacterium]
MGKHREHTGFSKLRMGDVFTPLYWGEFAVEKFGIFRSWLAGARIFDPTMGAGNLLEALITTGLKSGYSLSALPVDRLFGNELNTENYREALKRFREKYGLDMSAQFSRADILKLPAFPSDFLFGNPPWANYTDLPDRYKAFVRKEFVRAGLTDNSRSLLLGGSRVDLAALVVRKSITDFLKPGGEAIFFMPLSLLLNEEASRKFRSYRAGTTSYALQRVIDLQGTGIFNGVSTRFGLVHFRRDARVCFPVPWERREKQQWITRLAQPLLQPDSPLSILDESMNHPLKDFKPLSLHRKSAPRQGVNTCGANHVFFFDSYEPVDEDTCRVNHEVLLPSRFVFPLITRKNFAENKPQPRKWVLLPYREDGKPLTAEEINQYPALEDYLLRYRYILENRKGRMVGSRIRSGTWWAMLGVGAYSFAPWKVVWEAYGKKTFRPVLFPRHWQANQSLQAFIPATGLKEARRILEELRQPAIEKYLLSLQMQGTMNWAQPGRIKNLIRFI